MRLTSKGKTLDPITNIPYFSLKGKVFLNKIRPSILKRSYFRSKTSTSHNRLILQAVMKFLSIVGGEGSFLFLFSKEFKKIVTDGFFFKPYFNPAIFIDQQAQ